jgi:hypothetical protein
MKKKIALLIPYLSSTRVCLRTWAHAVLGGAASALTAHFTDPGQFSFNSEGLARMKLIAIGGAAIAVLHLFIDPPKP